MATEERRWVTVPMDDDMYRRIEKATARNEVSRSEYLRTLIEEAMRQRDEWVLRGPKKGQV